MKKLQLLIALFICFSSFSQTTYVPDDIFENYLETHNANGNTVSVGDATSMGNGIANDNYVTTSAINTVTDLEPSYNIDDMTGIEDFVSLTRLRADHGNFTIIDISNLTQLVTLYLTIGDLTELDLTSNLLLERIELIDNAISELDLSFNLELTNLGISTNLFSNIDLSNNTKLEKFSASRNTFSTLDFSNNSLLNWISVAYNQITALDLSSHNLLTYVSVSDNELSSLNVKNGNNGILLNVVATNNSNLICIEVDDAVDSANRWTLIDATTSFSEDCSDITYVPDDNFENYLETHDANGNTVSVGDSTSMGNGIANDNYVTTSAIDTVTDLNVSLKSISDMTGIENFISLSSLIAFLNSFTTIDVSNLTQLVILNIENGDLTDLDLTTNILLEELSIPFNQISDIDLSNNIELTSLKTNSNDLTSLNLLSNTKLTILHAHNNSITNLNLGFNNLLTEVLVYSNDLALFNMQNGNNGIITNFTASINSNLACINVDDVAYSTTNWVNIDAATSYGENCYGTHVPDDNFEAYLETHDASGNTVSVGDTNSMGNGIANDDYVATSAINTVTDLNVSSQSIADMTGIESFTALVYLEASNNSFTTLDVSNLTALFSLRANSGGTLTSLDLTNNLLLEDLRVQSNDLNEIDLSQNTELVILQIDNNNLLELDVIVNTKLTRCRVYGNQISVLDLSNNGLLTEVTVQNNELTYLNVKNGNNGIITNFKATGNSGLSCIQVDDAAYSTVNWTNIDAQTSFSETNYCNYTAIPDTNFEAALDALGYDDISNDGQVPTALIEVVTNLTVENLNISDITGIEDFVALTFLDCSNNSITTLDLSQNTILEALDCSFTNLSTLDLNQNTSLIALDCSDSNLENLYVKNGNNNNFFVFDARVNPNLTCIKVDDAAYSIANWANIDAQTSFSETDYCNYTAIPDINFEMALEALGYDDIFGDGQVPTVLIETLTSLNVGSEGVLDATGIEDFIALEYLKFRDNNITTIDISNLAQLETLLLQETEITSLNTTNNTQLLDLKLNDSPISTLDLTNNTLLEILFCTNCELSTIDLSYNLNLKQLRLDENNLISLDLSNHTALTNLRLSNNDLTHLNVQNGTNTNIIEFEADNVNLLCILVDDVVYSTTNWTGIDATTSFTETVCDDDYFITTWQTTSTNETITIPTNPDNDVDTGLPYVYDYYVDWGDGSAEENFTGDASHQYATAGDYEVKIYNDFPAIYFNNGGDGTKIISIDQWGSTIWQTMQRAFYGCTKLHINATDAPYLSQATDMSYMLRSMSVFNESINHWNVSTITNMSKLFAYANNFNQPLDNWEVGNVTLMNWMFRSCFNFNQDIGNWDTSKVTNLAYMFTDATVFDQDVGSWDIGLVTNTVTMFTSATLSTENYDALLIGWATDSSGTPGDSIDDIPTGLIFSGGNSTYCNGETAWNELDAAHGWTITDNGLDCDLYVSPILFLQGAFLNPSDTGLMNDNLRVGGNIPTTSPYTDVLVASATVFDLGGTSGTGAIDDDIVDWVWIELRDATDNTVVIDSQSALLQRDGDIVDVDGISALNFNQGAGNYYVAIAHRNHLGIITANTISLSSSETILDLTSDVNLILGGSNAVATTNSKLTLMSGDYDGNGQIQNSDLTQVTALLGTSGYSEADADMNSQIQNADINNIINPNIGTGEQTRAANQPIITAPLSAYHQSKKQ